MTPIARLLVTLPAALALASAGLAADSKPASPPAKGATVVEVADVTLTPPASWRRSEATSSMRVAEFVVPGKAGDASAVVYFFGKGGGGSVDDNVARWFGQFTPGCKDGAASWHKTESRDIAGGKVTVVQTCGTYESGMSMGDKTPKAGYALFGVIITSPGGPVFVKVTGPEATLAAAKADLEALTGSIRVKP